MPVRALNRSMWSPLRDVLIAHGRLHPRRPIYVVSLDDMSRSQAQKAAKWLALRRKSLGHLVFFVVVRADGTFCIRRSLVTDDKVLATLYVMLFG